MTERSRVESAFDSHEAFERDGDRFVVTTTVFDADVRIEEPEPTDDGDDTDVTVAITVTMPTIDAVVAGETVADVVQEGWFETLDRRLEDVDGATRLEPEPPAVRMDETAAEVVVETALAAERPAVAAGDAKAVVDYVEGTFVEGIIPGYTYREPAAGLIDRARSSGQRS